MAGVNLDEKVLGSECCLVAVGDEEETILRVEDSRVKCGGVGVERSEGGIEGGSREARGIGEEVLEGFVDHGLAVGSMVGCLIEEVVVVGVTSEGSAESDREFGNMQVEEALIGAVRWFAGPEGRGKQIEVLTMKLKRSIVRVVKEPDFIVGGREESSDTERAAAAERKFRDSAGGGRTVDLDNAGDDITDFESAEVLASVSSVSGFETAVFGKPAEDLD